MDRLDKMKEFLLHIGFVYVELTNSIGYYYFHMVYYKYYSIYLYSENNINCFKDTSSWPLRFTDINIFEEYIYKELSPVIRKKKIENLLK